MSTASRNAVDCKADGLAALAIAMPMRNDVADQVAAVHALGKLHLDIVETSSVSPAASTSDTLRSPART
jgi:hypothetical protein